MKQYLLTLCIVATAHAQPETLVERKLDSIRATVSIPEAWHVREDVEEGVVVFQFTREKVENAGDSFRAGLTLSVTPDIPGRTQTKPSEYASDLLSFAVEDGGGQVRKGGSPPFQTFRAEYTVESDAGQVLIVDFATANDTTGTLYFAAWQSPQSENDQTAPLREKILGSLVFDPQF